MDGNTDVVVTDGYTGNMVLKNLEGTAKSIGKMLKETILGSFKNKIAGAILKKDLDAFSKKMDYSEYGGSVLLGLDGTVVKAHGSSNAKAFYSAIRQAKIAGEENIVQTMRETVGGKMSKTAIIFPGQGAQKVGMASDLYNEETCSTEILNQAQEVLDFDLLETMFTDEEGKLGETENTQPALLTHSVALLEALQNLNADYTMGHSLGEYSSLVASGVLSFEDAVKIVRKRGQLMAQAFPNGVGSMAAVLGLDYEEVDKICKDLSNEEEIIEPANINSPGQIVVSGHKTLIDKLVEEGKTLGAKRVLPLAVSGPFHSSMMSVIEEDFASYINEFEWHDAKFPVVQNFNAQGETDAEVIKHNMVKQLYSPVQFIKSTEWLIEQGVDHFIEIGPGKVLSGLIKKINRDVKITSIQTLEDVKGWNENE